MTKRYAEKLYRVIQIYIHDLAVAMSMSDSPDLQMVLADLMDAEAELQDWIWHPTSKPASTWKIYEATVKRAAASLGALHAQQDLVYKEG